jgi:hypothetical protein
MTAVEVTTRLRDAPPWTTTLLRVVATRIPTAAAIRLSRTSMVGAGRTNARLLPATSRPASPATLGKLPKGWV